MSIALALCMALQTSFVPDVRGVDRDGVAFTYDGGELTRFIHEATCLSKQRSTDTWSLRLIAGEVRVLPLVPFRQKPYEPYALPPTAPDVPSERLEKQPVTSRGWKTNLLVVDF